MHEGISFPVGKVDFLDLYPLNFKEFLRALGEDVYWEIPDDLPKMTKLMIDGKALYIHRANFEIIDKELIK